MTLRYIIAQFECDGCGTSIPQMFMDPALELSGASLHDAAEEALKDDLQSSVQHDLHLCKTCTRVADNIGEEDYQPTRDEILEALQEEFKN
jgi:hypothetical protein